MQTELIIVKEYCQKSNLDPTFLRLLEEVGLIDFDTVEGEKYIYVSQLPRLEQYTRMYYDLSINIEGIDAIQHLLDRIQRMQNDISQLQSRLRLYE